MTVVANVQFNLPKSKMNLILLLKLLSLAAVLARDCEIDCSHIIDPVCGIVEKDGSTTLERYQNICHFNMMKCRLKDALVQQIPKERCGIKPNAPKSRRVFDFSIPGAHQSCNHICPTYCVDSYEPVCAFIHYHKDNRKLVEKRTMINHCHVDLFSCSVGVNVSIVPMNKCITGQSLLFMSSVAAMKTLGLLNEGKRRSSLPLESNVRAGLKEYKLGENFDGVGLHISAQTSSRDGKELADAVRPRRLGWIVIL